MSVVDEKVDGTVDGLKKVVEADEDSERLRQTKQRENLVKYIQNKEALSYKSLPIVLISLQYHITTTQHHYQIMDMVIDGSEGRRAKTHSDPTNFSEDMQTCFRCHGHSLLGLILALHSHILSKFGCSRC